MSSPEPTLAPHPLTGDDPTQPSRRTFLNWGTVLLGGTVAAPLAGCGHMNLSDTLREPSELLPTNGVLSLQLAAQYATDPLKVSAASVQSVYPAPSTNVDAAMRRYGSGLPAPTLRVKPGDTIRIKLVNALPPSPKGQSKLGFLNYQNSTNLHFHGLHVSPDRVGEVYGDYVVDAPDAGVLPGSERQHEIVIPKSHPPGVFWYHPHLHGSSGGQVGSGMFGAIVIEDPSNRLYDPQLIRERVIFVHKYNLNSAGRTDSFYDSAVTSPTGFLLNGAHQPTLSMRPGEVQVWHFINAATYYSFNPILDGHTIYAFARDGDPIPEGFRPANAQAAAAFSPANWSKNIQAWPGTFASPGSRLSFVVKASDTPGDYLLRSALSPWFNGPAQYEEVVARVRVEGDPKPLSLPTAAELTTYVQRYFQGYFKPISDEELARGGGKTRNVLLGVVGLTDPLIAQPIPASEGWSIPVGDGADSLAGIVFAAGDASGLAPFQSSSRSKTQTVRLNDVEEWTVQGVDSFPHPFHIHVNDSWVVKINGQTLSNPFWADTVTIPPGGSITFRMRFEDFKGPFVWHCHALDHEDLGMMQLVQVV
jgi:FtsP/CotA-like multicopper oxidase with cupredoxin domain